VSIDTAAGRRLTREGGVGLNRTTKERVPCHGLDDFFVGNQNERRGARKNGLHTVAVLSVIDKTHARQSSVRVRIVSVRALSKDRVRAVSYVAVKFPRVLYQAN
jgi:hypothetical protein